MQNKYIKESSTEREEKKKKFSKEEIKGGWGYLVSQGKVFKLFMLMFAYFLFLDVLGIIGIISSLWMLVLIAPIAFGILIAYFIYMSKHGENEMDNQAAKESEPNEGKE